MKDFFKRVSRLCYHPVFEGLIFILVIFSLFLMIVEKLTDLNSNVRALFILIEHGVLVVFLFEFILKFSLKKGQYFFNENGWVDLLTVTPLLIPLIEYLLLKGSVSQISSGLSQSIVKSIWMVRVVRTIRVVRVLRFLRAIRITKMTKVLNKDEKRGTGVLSVVLFLYLILSAVAIEYQKNTVIDFVTRTYRQHLSVLPESSAENFFQKDSAILMFMHSGGVMRRYNDRELKNKFQPHEYFSLSGDGFFVLISLKPYMKSIRYQEVFQLFIMFVIMAGFILRDKRRQKEIS